MKVTTAGEWKVHEGKVVSEDGVEEVIVISDGKNELVSGADPGELMVALATYLGVFSLEVE